jgi:hypothetical protein
MKKIEIDRQEIFRKIKEKKIIVINNSKGEDNEIKMDKGNDGDNDLPSL